MPQTLPKPNIFCRLPLNDCSGAACTLSKIDRFSFCSASFSLASADERQRSFKFRAYLFLFGVRQQCDMEEQVSAMCTCSK